MISVLAVTLVAWLWTRPGPNRWGSTAPHRARPTSRWRRRVPNRKRSRRTDDGAIVGAILVAVAARLRAGQGPAPAWAASLEHQPEPIASALAQAIPDVGTGSAGPVGPALALAPATRAAIASARAATELASSLGAELAQVLSACAEGIEESARAAADRAAALSGPTTTSRLLLGLPVAGLGLGMVIGADPVAFLTGTPFGWTLSTVALVLTGVGQWWIRRLVAHATHAGETGKLGGR